MIILRLVILRLKIFHFYLYSWCTYQCMCQIQSFSSLYVIYEAIMTWYFCSWFAWNCNLLLFLRCSGAIADNKWQKKMNVLSYSAFIVNWSSGFCGSLPTSCLVCWFSMCCFMKIIFQRFRSRNSIVNWSVSLSAVPLDCLQLWSRGKKRF